MRLYLFIMALWTMSSATAQQLQRETCSVDGYTVDINTDTADAVIGGIFDIRLPGNEVEGYGCGEPHSETILTYEAARWAINNINNMNYIPGIKLGMRAYDTCSSPYQALKAAQDFYPQFSSTDLMCNGTGQLKLGILGTLTSWTSKPVAEMTSNFPAAMISPRASSPNLSDKRTYPYFLRTGLSSVDQIKSMIALMDTLEWKRIIIVFSDNDYGRDGAIDFVRQSQSSDVCIAEMVPVPATGSLQEYRDSLVNLYRHNVQGAVYFGDNYSVLRMMEALPDNAANIQWIISSVDTNADFLPLRMRGAIFVQPEFTVVSEFFDYFVTALDENNPPPENPWYSDWFMSSFNCKLPGVTYAPYGSLSDCLPKNEIQKRLNVNSNFAFVDSTIKAVYTFAKALQVAHGRLCGTSGRCSSLDDLTPEDFFKYLKAVNFNFDEANVNINSLQGINIGFDENGDLKTSAHRFWNYQDDPNTGIFKFVDVGSYSNNVLQVNASQIKMYDSARTSLLPDLPQSPCPFDGCSSCIVPRDELRFNYARGDVVIAGLFDIHRMGSEVYTCGELAMKRAIEATAFKYAINTAKNFSQGILNGVDLGSLIFDVCDDAEVGRLLLNDALGGRRIISDVNGRVVDPNLLKATVGALDSTEAISIAKVLGAFKMPYMAAAATSVRLSDHDSFPYFSRAIPSDQHQMKALVLMVKKLGWTYIQVIYTDDSYGRGGYELIREIGADIGVCVAAAHKIMDNNYAAVVNNLQNTPDARAVIGVADSEDFRELLSQLTAQSLEDKYLLVGTETWSTKLSVVSGFESAAQGSLTIDLISPSVQGFLNWIDRLNPQSTYVREEMPFFREAYQAAFSCYLDASNRGIYNTECATNLLISNSPSFEQTPYAKYVIAATYAAARGIDMALRQFCGEGYDGICFHFRSSSNVRDVVLENIRNVMFSLDGSEFKVMDGEGQANYAIFNYQNGAYTRVGTYETETGSLELDESQMYIPPSFTSQCTQCVECIYLLQHKPFLQWRPDDRHLIIGSNLAGRNPAANDPLQCSGLRLTNGIQSFLAVSYAIETVRQGTAPVSLNDVNLSGIFFDHCNAPLRAYGLPSALYSGLLDRQGKFDASADLNKIKGWITDVSLVTEQMKTLFNELDLPVISPMSTSNMFLDEDEYPTFVRTLPGDSTIATALAILTKSLGLQYVTIVYSANSFGRDGLKTFTSIAQQEGVCIINSFEMNANTAARDIVSSLVGQSTHVVVTYLGLRDMSNFIDARAANINGSDLLIVSPEVWPLLYNQKRSSARGILSLKMKSPPLQGYLDFLGSMDYEQINQHTYIREWYEDLFQCNMPGNYRYSQVCSNPVQPITNSPLFYQDNYVLSTINSVYTLVAAAHETLKIKCGADYSGVCTDFYSDEDTNTMLVQKMTEVNYVDPSGASFEFIGKEGNSGRQVQLFDGNQLITVADFAGASVSFYDPDFNEQYKNVLSTCEQPCQSCILQNMNFTYIPGDILLGGIFDVHQSDLSPFSCGNINTWHGFQLLEAFHYAIEKVNAEPGILGNVRLGGVGLDACQSKIRTGYLVSNINNRLTTLERNGETIDPDSIDAYIGSYSSDHSIYLARLMKSLKIPQVSFGSTSIELLDDDKYPYFLRTVPADDKQAMAMIAMLSKFNIRYVQIVHQDTNYGVQGAAIFKAKAEENKICVAQTVSFPDITNVTPESANDVVHALLEKPVANTVVTFAEPEFVQEMLEAVKRNSEANNKFKFIGSDSWANNVEATKGVEEYAVGAVTLDLENSDIRGFDDYLSTKTPANYPENPWFSEYYEEINNCYLTVPTTRYGGRCPASPQDVSKSRRYKQDTVIIHVINAVYSAAYGIHGALEEVCGQGYSTVCETFKNLESRRELILHHIKKAEFNDVFNQPFRFTDRGDGERGYLMYSIEPSNILGYTYDPIAKYTSMGELRLTETDYTPSWDGSCEREDACTECPLVRNRIQRYMVQPKANDPNHPVPATLVMVASVHGTGSDPYRCGSMDLWGFLDSMIVLYTIEQLVLPSRPFALRGVVIDNCNNPIRIDQDLFNLFSEGKLCNAAFEANERVDLSTIIGVMTPGSRNVLAANRVTSPLKIPLLSSTATSTTFSDQTSYPYFARTVPPDDIQMKAVADLLKENGWKYISVVYTTESYGISGFRALRDHINEEKLSCIAQGIELSPFATSADIRAALTALKEKNGAGVVVVIASNPAAVLAAADAEGLLEQYLWIGTDSWGIFESVIAGRSDKLIGAITISFRDAFIDSFAAWMSTFTFNNRKYLPDDWFEEFYQRIHECKISNSNVAVEEFDRECTESETLTKEKLMGTGIGLLGSAAAYAVGKGLQEVYNIRCDDGSASVPYTLERCMNEHSDFRETLFQEILKQTWTLSDDLILTPSETFDMELGDDRFWNAGFAINVVTGDPDQMYRRIGGLVGDDFVFDKEQFETYKDEVVSACPEDELCNCDYGDNIEKPIAQTQTRYTKPEEPRNYLVYDDDTGKQTYFWPIWAIAVAVLTCCGLLVGLILFFYLLVFYPVRGGSTVLGFLMIIGTLGIYAINFAFFLPASEATCGARRFCQGVVYAIVFAALFVKAVDNWRFSNVDTTVKRYKGITSPFSLIMVALGIILIQCIIPTEWLILKHPSASRRFDFEQHDWMWCDPHDFYDISLVLSMIFVMVLVILTAIFAAMAWDSESNYYESRWIFVCCVCTAGCFLVWMIVTTNAGPPYRDPAIAIANFVNATVLLIFLPLRKLVLLCRIQNEDEQEKSLPPDMMSQEKDMYSTVYSNQLYEPDVFQVPDSKTGSDTGY